jgi:hypothetical protein
MVGNNAVNWVDYLGLETVYVDSSCKGHEDLLKNMSYIAEDEPLDKEGKKKPVVLRRLPAPGQKVAADAIYNGDGTAWKIPRFTWATVHCKCDEDGTWFVHLLIGDGLHIPFTDKEDPAPWKEGENPPPRWPGGDSGRPEGEWEKPPYTGPIPGTPEPPLNPEPIVPPQADDDPYSIDGKPITGAQ